VLPAHEVYGVYRRGLPGGIAVPDPAVVAVHGKAQRPGILAA
jgi:hypothetical protein